jgi:hypothetical protein
VPVLQAAPADGAPARAHFVRACVSGPVFDASTVHWAALRGGH